MPRGALFTAVLVRAALTGWPTGLMSDSWPPSSGSSPAVRQLLLRLDHHLVVIRGSASLSPLTEPQRCAATVGPWMKSLEGSVQRTSNLGL